MDVGSAFSIIEAERIISAMDGRGTDTTLTLPTHSRGHAAGGEPAVAQAVLTWASNQRKARVATYAEPGDGQLEHLSRHLVGLCAALACDQARDADDRDITVELRELALERLRGLQGPNPQRWSRGPQVEIVCADHLGRSTPDTLYVTAKPGKPLRARQEFDRVADLILAATVPGEPEPREGETLRDGIIDALYELFRNTDEYARRDEHGDRARVSVRGIHARRHAVSRVALAGMVGTSAPLAAYCERLQPRAGRHQIQLLEISVFDTGPGYASHWLGRPLAEIDSAAELAAVRTCFEKHATRKASTTSGMGLCTVVDVLRRGDGFMRLRTGRQSLYADLGADARRGYGDPPDLRPWRNMRMAAASGTLFTFMMPL